MESRTREQWVLRMGAFYSLLVAAQTQTRLPVAGDLVPSETDVNDSLRWLPVVGLGLGTLWAFVAAACLELGASGLVTGAFVVIAIMAGSAGLFELAASDWAGMGLARWRRSAQRADDGNDRLLVTVSIVALAVTLRLACIASLDPGEFTATLIAAAVLSRWSLSLPPFLLQTQRLLGPERDLRWIASHVGVGLAVLVTMLLCKGGAGVALMIIAGAAVALLIRFRRSNQQSTLLSLVLFIEICCLL